MWFSICSRPFHSCMPCLSRAGIYTKNNAIWVNSSYCLNFSINYFIKTSLNIFSVFHSQLNYRSAAATSISTGKAFWRWASLLGKQMCKRSASHPGAQHTVSFVKSGEHQIKSPVLMSLSFLLQPLKWADNKMQGICCFQWCELFWIYIRFAETHLCGQVFLI